MADFDSEEDSENEGGQGNVARVVIRPPGHSGKAKRGHLCFDASFETGNLGRVDLVSEFEYDLSIRPDTCNPRFRLWFNFSVDNVRLDQRVIFNIVNFSKHKNLFRDGMTPLVKSTSRPKWQRLPRQHVFYYQSPQHRGHHVLSFAFTFEREDDAYQFALGYPYSYSRCQAHLGLLEARRLPHFRRELVATTVQQRRLDVVTVTHPSNMKLDGRKQHVVVLLGRIHPGESPASFVCQGLMDFLVSSHPIAQILRQHIVFKIIPMMNPDGVFLGNYRSTLMGFDLNRSWNQISPWGHPTLHAVNIMLTEFDNTKEIDLDFVLDLHAHSSLLGVFMYGNTYDDVYRYERHIMFPKMWAQNTEDYVTANTMYNRDPAKAGTARRHFCNTLSKSVNCYTLEISFYGYKRPNGSEFLTYTEESYLRLGRSLARTCLDYYRAVGVVAAGLPTSPGARASCHSRPHRGQHLSRESSPLSARRTQERRSAITLHCHEIPTLELRLSRLSLSAGQKKLAGRKVGRPAPACWSGTLSTAWVTPRRNEPPRLSIIDFNQLVRNGLEQATGNKRASRKSPSLYVFHGDR
ncbi:cytosolic carboxypeptidase 6 [Bacillus rossius redtenbacheri]|uniref:cytosolic carboxypeptidase 6 n=1 Tax=Bacillus rossius redtenbacheri TaxID=93214 RepID=UPI002FDE0611